MDVKFSIIIPIYGVEEYLEKCLNSIFQQTYQNYEVIMVNDGSKDRSDLIMETFSKKDSRFLSFYKKNGGVSDARNFGVEKCTGTYFLFVDGDDYVKEDYLETIYHSLEKGIDVLKFQYAYEKDGKISLIEEQKPFDTTGEKAFVLLCEEKIGFDSPCIYAFRREYYLKQKFSFAVGHEHEDFGLIPLIIVRSKRVKSIPNSLYYYVQRENSFVHTNDIEKIKKKCYDMLFHYDFLRKEGTNLPSETKMIWDSYLSNSMLLCYYRMPKGYRKGLKKELEKRNFLKGLRSSNILLKLKKIYVSIRFKLSR